jgi:hypothetical protein
LAGFFEHHKLLYQLLFCHIFQLIFHASKIG